jgi:hypothetical protein
MKCFLVSVVSLGLSVAIAKADETRTPLPSEPSTVAPEQDVRLAKLAGAQPQKVGILTYYPNKGGGYTFAQGKDIVFYALPYTPSTYKCEVRVVQRVNLGLRGGLKAMISVKQSINVPSIGSSKVPFGGQTVYRTEMSSNGRDGFFRKDIRLAYWSRDTSDGKFRLSLLAEDSETRLKLKSIVPVLERAEHAR